MMDGLVHAVMGNARCGTARIEVEGISRNDIWTYSRAPGHRLAFPWSSGDLPPAIIQMDFVFEQKLHVLPWTVAVKLGELPAVNALVASNEESLAWKLLWLCSDMHPQGKDLYDAALLAECTELPAWLLKTVLEEAECWRGERTLRSFPFRADAPADVDWENFRKECPWVTGESAAWLGRLVTAVTPVVRELDPDRA